MTSLDGPASAPAQTAGRAQGLALPLFAATLFVSALLLFAVQPMFTKMVLPRLGGSPSVWSVAMVAFQSFLFAGYLYAHALARMFAPGRAAMIHLLVLTAVALTLPLGLAAGFETPPADGVTLWLLGLFVWSIGLPFAALSATAPLLQSWFAATGHAQARNPYVLYAASNLGSFAALLAYPFLIEPMLSLHAQTAAWSFGFGALAIGIVCAALVVARANAPNRARVVAGVVTARQRVSWVVLTAIPAGLCIAVTAHITTDLAAAPFLWILPLAIYLLTFVGVFRERPWIPHAWVLRLLPYVLAPLAVGMLGGDKRFWLAIMVLNLVAFALIAFACHGEAYRKRPEPAHLTEFYLWTSFGGVAGGVFAGLLAPQIFNNTYEYPLLMAAAVLVLPGVLDQGYRAVLRQAGVPLALAAAVIVARAVFQLRIPVQAELPMQVALVVLAALMLLRARAPARFFGIFVLALSITASSQAGLSSAETVRSFFGVHQVVETQDGSHRLLFHGTTIHGAERIRNADGTAVQGQPEPLTYYYIGGPISEAVDAARAQSGHLGRVAVVGLGTGSLACHRRPGEDWTFFEIDPEVIRIASDPARFRFLSACGGGAKIVAGDARLTLVQQPQTYDLIVIDAFSSDAIPVHLLTREALAGYLQRLAPGGLIAFHVSNRHMELASVAAAVGATENMVAASKRDRGADNFLADFKANAEVVVLSRSRDALAPLLAKNGWQIIAPRPDVPAWTDDYSDVLGAILRKKL